LSAAQRRRVCRRDATMTRPPSDKDATASHSSVCTAGSTTRCERFDAQSSERQLLLPANNTPALPYAVGSATPGGMALPPGCRRRLKGVPATTPAAQPAASPDGLLTPLDATSSDTQRSQAGRKGVFERARARPSAPKRTRERHGTRNAAQCNGKTSAKVW